MRLAAIAKAAQAANGVYQASAVTAASQSGDRYGRLWNPHQAAGNFQREVWRARVPQYLSARPVLGCILVFSVIHTFVAFWRLPHSARRAAEQGESAFANNELDKTAAPRLGMSSSSQSVRYHKARHGWLLLSPEGVALYGLPTEQLVALFFSRL